jgi:hypothetical protein
MTGEQQRMHTQRSTEQQGTGQHPFVFSHSLERRAEVKVEDGCILWK